MTTKIDRTKREKRNKEREEVRDAYFKGFMEGRKDGKTLFALWLIDIIKEEMKDETRNK